MVTRRWQHGSRGGGGGSMAAAASLAAEAAAWHKCNVSGSRSAFGNAAAAGKFVGTSFPDPKEAGRHKKQIAMRSDCYAQRPMECSTDKSE